MLSKLIIALIKDKGDLENFISYEYSQSPYNGVIVEENSVNNSDSYDYTDESFEKVIHFPEYDCYLKFIGWTKSYSGTEVTDVVEVRPTEVKTTTFKPVE